MRHAVDLSVMIESATEVVEINCVVTFSTQMSLCVLRLRRRWQC